MKAITLWQPWASWVAWEWKKIETRTHPRLASLQGKRIAIHAGKRYDREALRAAEAYLSSDERQFSSETNLRISGLFGCVVCLADVLQHRGPLSGSDSAAALLDCSLLPDRFGLVLANIETINPAIPARGRQGIWEWTPQKYRIDAPLFAGHSTETRQ